MKGYAQLTVGQRYHMYGLVQKGATKTKIAHALGVHKSTICRELKRNKGQKGWRPNQADTLAKGRKIKNTNAFHFGILFWKLIEVLLRLYFSPEQIAGRLKHEKSIKIHPETIYRYIYKDKQKGGDLWKCLRCQKKRKKRYGSGKDHRGELKNRVSIDERPEEVNLKNRIGGASPVAPASLRSGVEGDTVIGKNHKEVMVTVVERNTRYTVVVKLPSKEAGPVAWAIETSLEPHKEKVLTITFDNGKEFARHEEIAKYLDAKVYFAHPYSSWQRGLNENTNGLLRQFFKKGSDFSKITKEDVQRAMDLLNHRPRKVLGYRTPYEVFFGQEERYV